MPDIQTAQLPVIPVDATPDTVSATPNYVLVGAADAINPNRIQITVDDTTIAVGDTSITVVALTGAIPSGTVLDFNGIPVTLTAAAANAATALTVEALTNVVPNGAVAEYGEFRRVPLSEEWSVTLKDDNENIKVHGRTLPITSKNGIDFEAKIKTVAGIADPTVKDLVQAGLSLGKLAKRTFIFLFNDGFIVMCRALVGVMNPDGKAGSAQRYEASLMLAGDLYWANINEPTVTWKKVQ